MQKEEEEEEEEEDDEEKEKRKVGDVDERQGEMEMEQEERGVPCTSPRATKGKNIANQQGSFTAQRLQLLQQHQHQHQQQRQQGTDESLHRDNSKQDSNSTPFPGAAKCNCRRQTPKGKQK